MYSRKKCLLEKCGEATSLGDIQALRSVHDCSLYSLALSFSPYLSFCMTLIILLKVTRLPVLYFYLYVICLLTVSPGEGKLCKG